MSDTDTPIDTLKQQVADFCAARDWDQFHNLKDLALALSIEVAELLKLLRWKDEAAVETMLKDGAKRRAVEDELADVLYFVLRIAGRHGIDLSRALENKMAENEHKYPVAKARGRSDKYSGL